jgi:predicted enzyme related to lactoylglutathione lyase
VELLTTDQQAAKKFYEPLFGWTSNDSPMGPDEVYTMFRKDGRDAGAAYTLNKEMRAQGVPPNWALYVAVEDADAVAAKAGETGGSVLAGPFDVADYGRMAALQDPAGANFSVWQPKTHIGTGITDVPGTLCWADLNTPNADAAAQYYSNLFGWQISPGDTGYLHIKNGEAFIGGIPPASQHAPGAPPHWMIYFAVENCDASTAQAKELGASVFVGPMDIEKVGRMTVLADPQGAVLALFQPFPMQP